MKINHYDSLQMKAVKHAWNAIPTLFKGLTLILGMQTAVSGLPLFRRGNPYSIRQRGAIFPDEQIALASENSSSLKILNSKLCVQGTLEGPVSCDKLVTAEDFRRKNEDGTETRLDALSVTKLRDKMIFTDKVRVDGLVQICQTSITSGKNNLFPASTDCRTHSLTQFEPPQNNGYGQIPTSRDVTVGDPDLIESRSRRFGA